MRINVDELYHEIRRLTLLKGLYELLHNIIDDDEVTKEEIVDRILELIEETKLTEASFIYAKEKAEN